MPKTLSMVTAAACAAVFALSLASPASADCYSGHKDRTADASTSTVAQTPIPKPDKGS